MAKKKSTKPGSPPASRADLLPDGYEQWLRDIKDRVRQAQLRAAAAVNRELIELYWQIGKGLVERQEAHRWGNSVVDRLGEDLQRAFPGLGGFSRTNVYRMRAFYLAYRDAGQVVPQLVGQSAADGLPQAAAEIPWGHNVVLIERVKDPAERLWYARAAVEHGWSRAVLTLQIESGLARRQGKAVTNFEATLPNPQSDLARQLLKDPYNFDVRHDNREGIADTVSRILGRRYLSRPTYLEPKGKGDHSLLVKRRPKTRCPNRRAARLAGHGES